MCEQEGRLHVIVADCVLPSSANREIVYSSAAVPVFKELTVQVETVVSAEK